MSLLLPSMPVASLSASLPTKKVRIFYSILTFRISLTYFLYSSCGSSAGRCEKIPSTRGVTGKEMKHLPPFLNHREVYTYYLREPADTTMGRHVSLSTFNRVWAKYFSNVVTPKTKRFSQCDICSQVKEFSGRNIEVEVQSYKTLEEQNAHRQKYSDRAKYIADLKNFHFQRVSTLACVLPVSKLFFTFLPLLKFLFHFRLGQSAGS